MSGFITDLVPSAFSEGLEHWSPGNGTPGSTTYDTDPDGVYVPADADFGGCLEVIKGNTDQAIRYMGETPIDAQRYIEVSARVKVIAGILPAVRIAAYPVDGSNAHVTGLLEAGPSTTIGAYGEVVVVKAIIGTGARDGVDMVWTAAVDHAHIGLDIVGPNAAIVRIDDLDIRDVTHHYQSQLIEYVNVVDFGALGDGSTDNVSAFEAADAAANGRTVLVPEGVFALGDHVTLESKARFIGQVTIPADKTFTLAQNFELNSYTDAFGSELIGFEKAFQSLINAYTHESLDLCGRRVEIDRPIDMQAAVNTRDSFAIRRVVRNGQFYVTDSPAWDSDVYSSVATYSKTTPLTLTNVQNIAQIPIGSLVTGTGVGREIYVRSVDVLAQEITLSAELYDAVGTQAFTFTRHKYIADFSGFQQLDKFIFSDIEFQCNGKASGIMLAPTGLVFHLRDCFINKPKHRGLTSPGRGCQGMFIDRCQFLSNEQGGIAHTRETIALNTNANDVKIRDNRAVMFAHFAIMGGTGHMISDNHWFAGDSEANGLRLAGLIFTHTNVKTTVTGNYIDNCWIEWSNEHHADPDFGSEYSFGGLVVQGNIFMCSKVAPWFKFIVVKPYGTGHFLHGFSVKGNTFKSIQGSIDRVDYVDTSFAPLNYNRFRNVVFEANTFTGVATECVSPITFAFEQSTASANWIVDFNGHLPFDAYVKTVSSLVADGEIKSSSNARITEMPYTKAYYGANSDQVRVSWNTACRGKIAITARIDTPH